MATYFCVKCGNKVEVEQPARQPPQQPEPQPEPQATPPPPPQPTPPPQPVAPTYTPSPKPKSNTLKYVGVIAVAAILVIASFYVGFMMGGEDSESTGGARKITIGTGNKIPVTSGSAGYNGGSIGVSDTSSPLYGLNIEIPQAATEDTVTFDISYADITDSSGLPEGASIASWMINIETDGTDVWNEYKAFDKPCIVTLPYNPNIVTNDYESSFEIGVS